MERTPSNEGNRETITADDISAAISYFEGMRERYRHSPKTEVTYIDRINILRELLQEGVDLTKLDEKVVREIHVAALAERTKKEVEASPKKTIEDI